jgi:hypothetical protein
MNGTAQVVSRIPGGLQTFKYVMRQNPPAPVHFTATANTQTGVIVGIPANHVVVGVRVQLVTTFAGFGLSSCLVTVGADAGLTENANWYAPAFECVQAVNSTSFVYWSPFSTFTMEAHDITATFTSTGAQIAAMTAGEIEFTIQYRPL